MTDILQKAVHIVENVVAVLLVVLAALGVIDIVFSLYEALRDTGHLAPEGIARVLDAVLIVFIVLELFSIALAYLQHRDVIGTVMEAGLVAAVRKLVVYESGADALPKALALAVLILAIGVTWFLLRRSGVCTGRSPGTDGEQPSPLPPDQGGTRS